MSLQRQLRHAEKYAEALDTLYMLELYKQYYPHIFDHVELKTRPATNDDYFVPDRLNNCLVVETLRFNAKEACDRLGCFPFKNLGVPCDDSDEPQLSRLGGNDTTTLSCQKMCRREKTIDTEWWGMDGKRCVRVNPLKKLVVMFPERVFRRVTPNPYHVGLDWHEGQMGLNATYCRAYGMDFDGRECTMTMGQKIAEIFTGTTVYRSIRTQGLPKAAAPPTVYMDILYREDPLFSVEESDLKDDSARLALDVATDLSIDFGVDIGLYALEKFLKKRAPGLIARTTSNATIRKSLSAAVMRNYGLMLAKGSVHLGKLAGGVSVLLAAYGIINLVVDVIDPNMYSHLLSSRMIEHLNRQLDVTYFRQEDNFNQEITPDFVWNFVLDLENQSERISKMAENMGAYMQALQPHQPDADAPPLSSSFFDLNYHGAKHTDTFHWNWTIHLVILGMLLSMSIMWREKVHVWSLAVLCGIFAFHS